ncbi:hypothetical protein ACIA8O_18975 [Kitasatospora sp. NPDC051853]|uniref:hypothetical protein n=1 Tax=Kitasatospora sp. NPDC051853 TaxID=3364058 RepID=UPI00378936F8
MIGPLLVGLLALVVFGCVCTVWADRGGPRWTRGVATATQILAATARAFAKSDRRRGDGRSTGGDGGDGS